MKFLLATASFLAFGVLLGASDVKLIDKLHPLYRLVGKWNWSYIDPDTKSEVKGAYVLEADPGGHSLIGYIPDSNPTPEASGFFMRFLWYWEPQRQLVSCISVVTRGGIVGTSSCSSESLQQKEWIMTYAGTDSERQRLEGLEHFKIVDNDTWEYWETDKTRDGKKVPGFGRLQFKRVK